METYVIVKYKDNDDKIKYYVDSEEDWNGINDIDLNSFYVISVLHISDKKSLINIMEQIQSII